MNHSRAGKIFLLAGGIAGILVMILALQPHPSGSGYFPPCPTKYISGYECPGCGTLRALHYLMQGEWGEAIRHNALALFFLPVLAYAGLRFAGQTVLKKSLPRLPQSRWISWSILVLVIAFAVVRNLPGMEGLRP